MAGQQQAQTRAQAHPAADRRRAWHLGLTGGIGSGKSTVASLLAEQVAGARVLDADAISRSVTAAGGAAIAPIAQAFGAQAIAPDGALDRAFMRQLVFQQPQARQRLEAIVHPLIAQAMQQQAAQAEAAGAPLLVFDLPLLVESGRWRQQMDAVLVVDCRESTQVQRVMQRSGLSAEAVQAIMATQASRAQRRAVADWVIFNDDGLQLPQLRALVQDVAVALPL